MYRGPPTKDDGRIVLLPISSRGVPLLQRLLYRQERPFEGRFAFAPYCETSNVFVPSEHMHLQYTLETIFLRDGGS